MKELHLTKKDFTVEWFSGQGAGGQHRNKHQNCCRIIHNETGLTAVCQKYRNRVSNQREAFTNLANRIIAFYFSEEPVDRFKATEVIRNYHAERNEVHDKLSGLKKSFKDTIGKNDISDFIKARRTAMVN